MIKLPNVDESLLIRTEFSDDAAWRALLDHVGQENGDGFRAYVEPVDDINLAGSEWPALKSAVPENESGASLLFVADQASLSSEEHPILVVDLMDDRQPFRCAASYLWGVENNLNISNMDWEEFADAIAKDGVFRGF